MGDTEDDSDRSYDDDDDDDDECDWPIAMLCPYWFCRFERTRDTTGFIVKDISYMDEIEQLSLAAVFAGEADDLDSTSLYPHNPRQRKLAQRLLVLLDSPDHEMVVAAAHDALEKWPQCPEAHLALVLHDPTMTLDRAMQLLKDGDVHAARVMLDGDSRAAAKAAQADGAMWLHPPARCVLRIRQARAALYLRHGQAEKAKKDLSFFAEFDGKWEPPNELDNEMCSWTNWYALMPEYEYRVNGPQAAIDYMAKHPYRAKLLVHSASIVPWAMTLALAQLATGVQPRFVCTEQLSTCSCHKADLWTLYEKGGAAVYMAELNKHLIPLLLGDCAMPSEELPLHLPTIGYESAVHDSFAQAVAYVHCCADMWQAVPNAMHWLRLWHNTQKLFSTLHSLSAPHQGAVSAQAVRSWRDGSGAARLIQNGVFVKDDPLDPESPSTLLELAVTIPAQQVREEAVEMLLKVGSNACTPRSALLDFSVLHGAAYFSAGPKVVRMLLKAGADPLMRQGYDGSRHYHHQQPEWPSPLEMAASNGFHRELEVMLDWKPQCRDPARRVITMWAHPLTILEHLFVRMMSAQAVMCVAGGPMCKRCKDMVPIHRNASPMVVDFRACIALLVDRGLRSTRQVESVLAGEARWDPECWQRYYAPLVAYMKLRVTAARKADKAGGKGSKKAGGQGSALPADEARTEPQRSGDSKADAFLSKAIERLPGSGWDCWGCGEVVQEAAKVCAACRHARYCGGACQAADWQKAHGRECAVLAKRLLVWADKYGAILKVSSG